MYYWHGLAEVPSGWGQCELAELRQWVDTVLRQHYGGYELRDCWTGHIHAVWELSTLAAEWHHAYDGQRPDLARALEFHDRWLPGTMRRIAHITRTCVPNASRAVVPGDRRAGGIGLVLCDTRHDHLRTRREHGHGCAG